MKYRAEKILKLLKYIHKSKSLWITREKSTFWHGGEMLLGGLVPPHLDAVQYTIKRVGLDKVVMAVKSNRDEIQIATNEFLKKI